MWIATHLGQITATRQQLLYGASSVYANLGWLEACRVSNGSSGFSGRWRLTCHSCCFSTEIGDIAGVADVTIRQSYRLIYPRAAELFPPDFKFDTPVDKLPQLWNRCAHTATIFPLFLPDCYLFSFFSPSIYFRCFLFPPHPSWDSEPALRHSQKFSGHIPTLCKKLCRL